MASKRRLRRKQCERKRRFETYRQAAAQIVSICRNGKKHGGWLHVYKCRFCGGYHFGHARGSKSSYEVTTP